MADIVNLRQARKAKAKQSKEAKAAANRVQFGRTKAEKTLSTAQKANRDKRLDGHKMTDTEGDE